MAQPLNFSNPYRTDLSTPGSIFGTSGNDQMPGVSQTPAAPFVWGQGGARLTPEQLALRQEQATQLQQPDYSPVASPWQGLARASGQWLGAFQQKGLDKEYAAQNSVSKSLIQGLTNPDPAIQQQSVAAALTSGNPTAQKLALQVDKRLHPDAPTPTTLERYGALAHLTPDQISQGALGAFKGIADPLTNLTVGGNSVIGPRSVVEQQFGGGSNADLPTVRDQAAWDSLRTGQQFLDGEGNVRVKP